MVKGSLELKFPAPPLSDKRKQDAQPEQIQPRAPELEFIKGDITPEFTENEQLAAQRVQDIENKIKKLDQSFKEKPSNEWSNLDAAKLEILNRQLPRAETLLENLTAMHQLEGKMKTLLQSMQGIIAPGEKHNFSFVELQDIWSVRTDKTAFSDETLEKLTDELDKLSLEYGKNEAQYAERQNLHLQLQEKIAELQEDFAEADAAKKAIVEDIATRIQIKKQGGSLAAESSSAVFEQLGDYLSEYQNAFSDEQQRLVAELSRLDEQIPFLEQKTGGAGEWLKQLFKKTPERARAKDQLAEARAKKRETINQLERLNLIARALGFTTGHIGVTQAGLSNLESRLQFTAGAGIIGFKPMERARQTSTPAGETRTAVGHGVKELHNVHGAESLMNEILKKAAERDAAVAKTLKPPPLPVEYEQDKKTQEIKEESVTGAPYSETAIYQTSRAPEETQTSKDALLRESTPNKASYGRIEQLRDQTPNEKAMHIMDYILASAGRETQLLEERSARFEEKVNTYIDLIVSPKEITRLKEMLDSEFMLATEDESPRGATMRLLRQRLEFAKQKLDERAAKKTKTDKIEFSAEELLGELGEKQAQSTGAAAPLHVEHKNDDLSVIETETSADIAKTAAAQKTVIKKPAGRFRKWIAGILSATAIGGAAYETNKQLPQKEKQTPAPTAVKKTDKMAGQSTMEINAPDINIAATEQNTAPEIVISKQSVLETKTAAERETETQTPLTRAAVSQLKPAARITKNFSGGGGGETILRADEEQKIDSVAGAKKSLQEASAYMRQQYGPIKQGLSKGPEKPIDISSVGIKGAPKTKFQKGAERKIERILKSSQPKKTEKKFGSIDLSLPKEKPPKLDIQFRDAKTRVEKQKTSIKESKTDIEPTTILGHLGKAELQLNSAKIALIKLVNDRREHRLTDEEAEKLRVQLISAIEDARKQAWAVRDDAKANEEEIAKATSLLDSITKISARGHSLGIQEGLR